MEHRLHLIWISRGLGRASKWTENASRAATVLFVKAVAVFIQLEKRIITREKAAGHASLR